MAVALVTLAVTHLAAARASAAEPAPSGAPGPSGAPAGAEPVDPFEPTSEDAVAPGPEPGPIASAPSAAADPTTSAVPPRSGSSGSTPEPSSEQATVGVPRAEATAARAQGPGATGAEATESAGGDPEAPCEACWDEVFRRSSLGFGMGVGVAYLPEMVGVNERLTSAGHDELSTFSSYFVISVPVSIDHVMLLAQVRMTSIANEAETSRFESLHGMISAGYSITPPEVLAIYPFAGIGIASASLSLGQTTPLGVSFDQVAAGSQGPLELSSLAFVGTAGMAAELLVARTDDHPTRGIFVGARVGATASFTSSDWSLGTGVGSVPDGPRPPLGGYYAELSAGLRL